MYKNFYFAYFIVRKAQKHLIDFNLRFNSIGFSILKAYFYRHLIFSEFAFASPNAASHRIHLQNVLKLYSASSKSDEITKIDAKKIIQLYDVCSDQPSFESKDFSHFCNIVFREFYEKAVKSLTLTNTYLHAGKKLKHLS